ncbi:histidine phosphatase family protein [Roseibium denhamense]|uniref:phosphoglycerate mutase (2,3-diphosphoglycerate-dependent) n=1 Tax=Roseibium denhamense TaxID=76305 RepID=A0ABY1NHC8_9HYPH|nr:histidine phosphatase family protein [Roseibium denhamense]MTI06488.1 histidine phosphatase family protein [Roseibium denhamense]SMP09475.1 2,3-bisphosphoglycerate-dependent phosphoglycerate mutase [Roseibium denhamense]
MTDRFAILVRHGDYHQRPDTPSALQPYGLTETGSRQAEACGAEIASLAQENGWQLSTKVLCSRQLRAWQTATQMLPALSMGTGSQFIVEETEALAERSVGALANLTLSEIEDILDTDPRFTPPPANWKSDSHFKLPVQGAESLIEAGRRVAAVLETEVETLAADTSANAQIFVGHGASIRHAALHLDVLRPEEIQSLSMHHARPVVLRFSRDNGWSHAAGDWKQRSHKAAPLD